MKNLCRNKLTRSVAGLRACVQDQSATWINRLKIIRHMWMNDVALLNQQQFLLDFVLESLAAKKREMTHDEHLGVWRCLDEILQGLGKNLEKTKPPSTCLIKTSVIQYLLDQLELCTSSNHDQRLDDIIISCCYTLLTSLETSFSVISKFENMLRLLSTAITLAGQNQSIDSKRLNCLKLIHLALPVYMSAQRQKTPSHQVLNQVGIKLLGPSINWILMIETQCESADADVKQLSRSCVHELKDILSSAIFHKDLIHYYELFLKLKGFGQSASLIKQEKAEPLPKFIDGFFVRLHAKLESEDACQSVLHCLPFLFTQFTAHYGLVSEHLPFTFLEYICRDVLGIPLMSVASIVGLPSSTSRDISMDTDLSSISDDHRLDALSSLLGCVSITDVYVPAQDDVWLSSVVDWLLSLRTRCSSFYQCFRWVIQIAPQCSLEANFTLILVSVWSTNPVGTAADVISAQDQLLKEIVAMHLKMKRMKQFVDLLLKAINMMTDASATFPKEFMISLRIGFSYTMQNTMFTIWKTLNKELNKSHKEFIGLEAVCQLASLFLRSVNIDKLGRIDASLNEFGELYCATLNNVMALTTTVCLDSVTWSTGDAFASLSLLRVCGELRLNVPGDSAGHISEVVGSDFCIERLESHFSDLSFLY